VIFRLFDSVLAEAEPGEVLEDDVVVVVVLVRVSVATLLHRAHLLEGLGFLLVESSRCRIEEFEGHVGDELAAEGAAVQLDPQRVGDDDTDGVYGALAFGDQSRAGEVGVVVAEAAVEGHPAAVFVGGGEGHQVDGFGEAGPGGDGAALAGLQARHVLGELRVDHRHFAVLHHVDFHVSDGFAGVVADGDAGTDLLAVVVDLAVEGHLEVDLAGGEGEAFGDDGARKSGHSSGTRHNLELLDGEGDGAALVAFVLLVGRYVDLQIVLDAQRLALVVFAGLEGDGAGGHLREAENEGVGHRAHLLGQFLLDGGQIGGLLRRDDLVVGDHHLLAELHPP
jgi:hypothetical protein